MTPRVFRYRITCSTEDPHAPARVMGILAARSLLPLAFTSKRLPGDRVLIEIHLEEFEDLTPSHLARLFERLQFVSGVELELEGSAMPFRHSHDHAG